MTAITRKQLELAALAYGIDDSWIGNAAYMDGMLCQRGAHTWTTAMPRGWLQRSA